MRPTTSSRSLWILAGLALCGIGFSTHLSQSFARPAAVEPPLEFQLQVGDQHVPVALDEAFTVTLDGEAVRMMLTVAPDRLFDNAGGVRFRYPKDMVFAYDGSEPNMKLWSFDGTDCVVLLFKFEDQDVAPADVLTSIFEEMLSKFGRGSTRVTDIRSVLGGRTFKGRRLVARIAGEAIQQDYVAFQHSGDAYVLSVQDSLTDSGQTTAETRAVQALLARTFKFPE